jgi:hypothetical protein
MRRLAEAENIGHNRLWRLVAGGELDSVLVGTRNRHIILESWIDFIERQKLGVPRNAVQKAAAIASYRSSLAAAGGTAAARARRGTAWGRKLAAEAEGGALPGVLTDPPGTNIRARPSHGAGRSHQILIIVLQRIPLPSHEKTPAWEPRPATALPSDGTAKVTIK